LKEGECFRKEIEVLLLPNTCMALPLLSKSWIDLSLWISFVSMDGRDYETANSATHLGAHALRSHMNNEF